MNGADHLEVIDTTVQKTYGWLRALSERLEGVDRRRAYQILRAFLHALRDRLVDDEAAHLGAQLPILLRGVYYEGWRPGHKPDKMRADEFLGHVESEAGLLPGDDVTGVVRAAAAVVRGEIAEGEWEKLLGELPRDLRRLLGSATTAPG